MLDNDLGISQICLNSAIYGDLRDPLQSAFAAERATENPTIAPSVFVPSKAPIGRAYLLRCEFSSDTMFVLGA